MSRTSHYRPEFGEKQAVAFLKSLIATPSVSGYEQAVASLMRERLAGAGFDLIDSFLGNAIGIKTGGSEGPTLLLSSHMDTVNTRNPFRVVEDRIYGAGAVDCKPSLGAMTEAACTYDWDQFPGRVIVAGLVQEEINTIGLHNLFAVAPRPDYAIFGEPTRVERICIGYRGRVHFRLTTQTVGGHVAAHWGFLNAVEAMWTIWQAIRAAVLARNPPDVSYFYEVSPNLTLLRGGETANSVPEKCFAEIDIRIPVGVDCQALWTEIQGIVAEVAASITLVPPNATDDDGLDGTAAAEGGADALRTVTTATEVLETYNAVETVPTDPLLGALRWAAFKTTGKKITTVKKTGCTFTNLIVNEYQVPCVTYGPGNPQLEHTNYEYIEIPEYLETVRVYHTFFDRFADLARRGVLKKRE